jgi:predicted transcriptional regulator
MKKARSEEQEKLRELNKRFLEEIESGRGWEDVKHLMEEMKEVAKRIDPIKPETPVVDFDSYPLNYQQQSGT